VARGWESKAIESQQDEAAREATGRAPQPLTDDERSASERRRTLELARARAVADLRASSVPAHQQMLRRTIEAIDQQLEQLQSGPRARS
jgi:hypothetical protein